MLGALRRLSDCTLLSRSPGVTASHLFLGKRDAARRSELDALESACEGLPPGDDERAAELMEKFQSAAMMRPVSWLPKVTVP